MAFADIKRSQSAAHKYTFRVSAIEGSTVRVLWEGDKFGEGEVLAEQSAVAARERGSKETITLDSFRLDVERVWCERHFTSRAPSAVPIRRVSGNRGRPRILYMPLEFPTWLGGGHSWSYAANLAYADGLRAAGCDVTVVNTAAAPHHRKIIRDQRFDQVWIHSHPRHLSDFAFRQWVSDIAPVRLLLCGESVHYSDEQNAAEPWSESHTKTFQKWAPHVTHAAFVDPSDVSRSTVRGPAMVWRQAAPARFIRPVNERPSRAAAVFVGTLYPPRDRWVWDLGGLVERVECPESDAFAWLFEHSHEWVQRAIDSTGTKSRWWIPHALGAYNRFQSGLRRHAFGNFIAAIRDGVAVVSLPSMVKAYSGRVVEGMAAGRPVLTQRIPGHAPIFDEGAAAEILHYTSTEDLAEHIRRLQAEPKLANAIAARARAALVRSHTVERRAAELLAFAEGA